MYANQLPNMYQFQAPNNYNQISQLIRVTGLDGAKAYQMNANSTIALFDNGSDVMYIKSTDGVGFPTIRTFKFEEVHNNVSVPVNEYVSKEEFEQFKKELKEYGKQSFSRNNKSTKQTEFDSNNE